MHLGGFLFGLTDAGDCRHMHPSIREISPHPAIIFPDPLPDNLPTGVRRMYRQGQRFNTGPAGISAEHLFDREREWGGGLVHFRERSGWTTILFLLCAVDRQDPETERHRPDIRISAGLIAFRNKSGR